MLEAFGSPRHRALSHWTRCNWKTRNDCPAPNSSKARGSKLVTGSNETNSVRQLAAAVLLKVESRQAYADILLDQTLKATDLNERDRALLTELVYGTLRWRGTIDARLARQLRRPWADTDAFIRNLLRVTVYQLFFLDRIPDYAAVNEAVEVAKRARGAKGAGFVNGVLRNLLRRAGGTAEASDSAPASREEE